MTSFSTPKTFRIIQANIFQKYMGYILQPNWKSVQKFLMAHDSFKIIFFYLIYVSRLKHAARDLFQKWKNAD